MIFYLLFCRSSSCWYVSLEHLFNNNGNKSLSKAQAYSTGEAIKYRCMKFCKTSTIKRHSITYSIQFTISLYLLSLIMSLDCFLFLIIIFAIIPFLYDSNHFDSKPTKESSIKWIQCILYYILHIITKSQNPSYFEKRNHSFYFIAKFLVHSLAVSNACCSFVFQTSATLLSNGSSGFGADINAWILNNTVLICNAGLHLSFKISRQIRPSLSTFGWYILVRKRSLGGVMGYSDGRNNSIWKTPCS